MRLGYLSKKSMCILLFTEIEPLNLYKNALKLFSIFQLQKMGKTRKGFKNEIRTQDKTPLDEQILSGKVARSKNKVKIRLRAEEENVSRYMKITDCSNFSTL